MIKTDPVWGVGKQVVVPFLMGHLGLRKMEMARGLSRLGCPSSPCDGVGMGGWGHTNRVRERQSMAVMETLKYVWGDRREISAPPPSWVEGC